MRSQSTTRWVLAFDSSCCECATIADEVRRYGDDRLDVMPLGHPDILAWRRKAFGDDPPFAPTLVRIRPGRVQAWLGLASGMRLSMLLGPASTWRLARALARMRRQAADHQRAAHPEAARLGRKDFLRLGGMGMVAAILVGRAAPASAAADGAAASPELQAAREWVTANRGRLPQTYTEFVTHDAARRKVIYAELSPQVRSRLWVQQLTGYRTGRAGHTLRQQAVLESGLTLAADASIFDGTPPTGELHQRLEKLRVEAIDAFGPDRARVMFTNLGSTGAAAKGICGCSCRSDWCSGSSCVCCASCGQCCYCLTLACGTLDLYECRGDCV